MKRARLAHVALASLLLLAPRLAVAQRPAAGDAIPVQAGATLERDTVTVGDVVRLTIRVRAPLGATIAFPALTDTTLPVQALEPPRVASGADSARAADRIATYRLAGWKVGALQISLGEIVVQTDAGERRIAVPLPGLVVRSVLPADSTLRVPKPARDLIAPAAVPPWWLWPAIVAGVVALVLLAWWWSRRRREQTGPARDPFGDAVRDLERIDRLGLIAAGEAGRHATLVADVARRYLAVRIDGASLAQTSAELLEAVQGARTLPGAARERLARLLGIVDGVKFARAPISAGEAREVGAEARLVVQEEHARAMALAAAAATAAATRPPADAERAA